jgi:hypothetical protein
MGRGEITGLLNERQLPQPVRSTDWSINNSSNSGNDEDYDTTNTDSGSPLKLPWQLVTTKVRKQLEEDAPAENIEIAPDPISTRSQKEDLVLRRQTCSNDTSEKATEYELDDTGSDSTWREAFGI